MQLPSSSMGKVKANASVNSRSTKFNKSVFDSKTVPLKTKFKFKTPTPEDLKRTQKKNRKDILKAKIINWIFLIFSLIGFGWLLVYVIKDL